MRKRFCGRYGLVRDDFHAETMTALTECGVPVYWRKIWNRYGRIEDNGYNPAPEYNGKWKLWQGEDLAAMEYEGLSIKGEKHWLCSYIEVCYQLPDEKLALVIARDKEIGRRENEEARQWLEADYKAWCERRQRQVEALLKKKPWLEDPHTGFDMARECAAGLVYDRQIAPEAVC